MPAVELHLELDTEAELIRAWRVQELERAGYGPDMARELAELHYVDLHEAVGLMRRGCLPELALRILV